MFADEEITTGPDARLALTFNDSTALTVGESARVTLDEFVFNPAGENRLRLTVTGAFRYVSGALAKGATRPATVTTPIATIGVRGTDFWGGPINGVFGVVVLEGAVAITTTGGTVEVSQPGQGVHVVNGNAGQPVVWSREKVDRALATVTFR